MKRFVLALALAMVFAPVVSGQTKTTKGVNARSTRSSSSGFSRSTARTPFGTQPGRYYGSDGRYYGRIYSDGAIYNGRGMYQGRIYKDGSYYEGGRYKGKVVR